MNKRKSLIGLVVIIVVAAGLYFANTTNFFGQGAIINRNITSEMLGGTTDVTPEAIVRLLGPATPIKVLGPETINQAKCSDTTQTFSGPNNVDVHTWCNAAEFVIATGRDLDNITAIIRNSAGEDVVRYVDFEPVMSAGQLDSITWDGISCGSERCPVGEYTFQAYGSVEGDMVYTYVHEFEIVEEGTAPGGTCEDINTVVERGNSLVQYTLENGRTISSDQLSYIVAAWTRIASTLDVLSDSEVVAPTIRRETLTEDTNSLVKSYNLIIRDLDCDDPKYIKTLPVLLSPEDRATDVSTTPTLSWKALDVSGRVEYSILVSENADLSDPTVNIGGHPQERVSLTTGTPLDPGTGYYWSVSAGDIDYPQIFRFKTGGGGDITGSCSLTGDEGTDSNPFDPSSERLRFTIDSDLAEGTDISAFITIEDEDRNKIETIYSNERNWPLEKPLEWDGLDDDGSSVGTGTYRAILSLRTVNYFDEDDTAEILDTCKDTFSINLDNDAEGVEITVESSRLTVGEPFEIRTDIPFSYTKKVINVYNSDNDLIDTVFYECARGETCPVTSSSKSFPAELNDRVYYDGILRNGTAIPEGERITFKLWVRPISGSPAVDYSERVTVDHDDYIGGDCEFRDVPVGHPDFNAVQYVCSRGLFRGHPDRTMRMNDFLTRAQLMTVAGRTGELTGICPAYNPYDPRVHGDIGFIDINDFVISDPNNRWKLDALLHTASCGIIRGYADGTVRLDQVMTHAEWWKVALISGRLFVSDENTDPWFAEYERYLVDNGIYPPNGLDPITRGDAIRLLYTLRNQLRL